MPDQHYTSPAARDLRRVMREMLGIDVHTDEELTEPAMVHRGDRAVFLRPGLALRAYRWYLGEANITIRYPEEAVLMREPHRTERRAPGGALVLPFVHGTARPCLSHGPPLLRRPW